VRRERPGRGGRQAALAVLLAAGALGAVGGGWLWGTLLAHSRGVRPEQLLAGHRPALPTRLYDRHGRLITEFFSEEKRTIVAFGELPEHLVDALLTREDRRFFAHRGFRVTYILRAAWDILTGRSFRGGSTITQQLAGHLFADRTEITLRRKLRELWWALRLEQALSKQEILELYLNEMYFGHNTYGVEEAARFYFRRSARELSLAESVMLVIQLASPGRYSPFNNPNAARTMQRKILDQMVALGFASSEQADRCFEEYWEAHDYSRSHISSAWFDRRDRAPYFSEHVRQQLETLLLGSLDLYRAGLEVHTTLDLELQQAAEGIMDRRLRELDERVRLQDQRRLAYAYREVVPLVDLLSLAFNIEDIRASDHVRSARARERYLDSLNPTVDILAMTFGLDSVRSAARVGYEAVGRKAERRRVEGALVALDSATGEIRAMVGGRRYERTNQFNRAVQARVQPGSAFKPLYYASALSARVVTPATVLVDAPTLFRDSHGNPYVPLNYRGQWKGRVSLREALAQSMNVPSLQVLDAVGFPAAIATSSRLLGISDLWEIERRFPFGYPLGLGVGTVSPLQMARAYAVFANHGLAVEPTTLRSITDREGRPVLQAHASSRSSRVLTPAEAHLMVSLLESTVESGTLRWAVQSVGGLGRPVAGKTGTTQNWSDAWTVGFTPQLTTAVWFGFDRGAGTLGVSLSGAVSAAPAWAEFMKHAHQDLAVRQFERPPAGLVEALVCRKSGLLPTSLCGGDTHAELFLSGTEPRTLCDYHRYAEERHQELRRNIRKSLFGTPGEAAGALSLPGLPPFDLDLDLESAAEAEADGLAAPRYEPAGSEGNPFLD